MTTRVAVPVIQTFKKFNRSALGLLRRFQKKRLRKYKALLWVN
jgi:hypothetical protein